MEDFGQYLRSLRLERKLSLREVHEHAGISVSYLNKIEKNKRKPPGADILRRLAQVYTIPVKDLLRVAGYLDEETREPDEEEEVEMAFQFVISDPRYKSGQRVKAGLDIEVKRFVVEMYEKATGRKLLP